MAEKKANPTKVVTGKVRLSYVHLFEPWSNDPEKEKKYSCMLLIPKSDRETIRKLRAAETAAVEGAAARVFGGKVPKVFKSIIKDGDEPGENYDPEEHPERNGCWYMTVSAKTRPGIVDRDREPIVDSGDVYSGCYARVSLGAFAYSTSGNKGVSFGLNNVQKLADGDYLGGRSRAEDDFDDDLDDDDDDLI